MMQVEEESPVENDDATHEVCFCTSKCHMYTVAKQAILLVSNSIFYCILPAQLLVSIVKIFAIVIAEVYIAGDISCGQL